MKFKYSAKHKAKSNTKLFVKLLTIPVFLAGFTNAQAAVSITGTNGTCTPRSGSGHASTIMFFDSTVKNVVATNNEFQRAQAGGDDPISRATNLTFDVWQSNGTTEGTCVGNIVVTIDAATNERAEIVVEDHLTTPTSGSGVLVRTGQTDVRGKIDTYVETNDGASRRIIWNNFTGIPNASRLMSGLRFAAGQHLAIYYTGSTATAEAKIQLFDNAGNFIGVADEIIGKHSSIITDDVLSLAYKDLQGNAIAADKIPKDGEGYLRILGQDDDETEASCMIIYTKAKPDEANGAWDNTKLASTTITFARRNGGNDPLTLGE